MEQKLEKASLKRSAILAFLTLTLTSMTVCNVYSTDINDFIIRTLPPEKAEQIKQKDTEYLLKLCKILEENKEYEDLTEEELEVVKYNRRYMKYDPSQRDKNVKLRSIKDVDKSKIYFIPSPDSIRYTLRGAGSSRRPLSDFLKCLKIKYNVYVIDYGNVLNYIEKYKSDIALDKEILKYNVPVCYFGIYGVGEKPTEFIFKISCPFIHIEKEFISKDDYSENFGTPEDIKHYYTISKEMYNWIKRELQIRNLLKEEKIL